MRHVIVTHTDNIYSDATVAGDVHTVYDLTAFFTYKTSNIKPKARCTFAQRAFALPSSVNSILFHNELDVAFATISSHHASYIYAMNEVADARCSKAVV